MVLVTLGIFDAGNGVIRSNHCSFVFILTVHICAHESGSVNIAGSVAALCDSVVLVILKLAVLVYNYACSFRLVGNAGKYNGLLFVCLKFLDEVKDISLVIGLLIFRSG